MDFRSQYHIHLYITRKKGHIRCIFIMDRVRDIAYKLKTDIEAQLNIFFPPSSITAGERVRGIVDG